MKCPHCKREIELPPAPFFPFYDYERAAVRLALELVVARPGIAIGKILTAVSFLVKPESWTNPILKPHRRKAIAALRAYPSSNALHFTDLINCLTATSAVLVDNEGGSNLLKNGCFPGAKIQEILKASSKEFPGVAELVLAGLDAVDEVLRRIEA